MKIIYYLCLFELFYHREQLIAQFFATYSILLRYLMTDKQVR